MGFAEVWWAVGAPILVAALGFGTVFALSDSSWTEFWFARIAYTVAGVDVAGFLAYWLWAVVRWVPLFRIALAALAGAILLLSLNFTLLWIDRQEVRLSKTLISRNIETPPIPAACKPPAGAVMIFLGSDVAIAEKMPSTIVEMGGRKMLTIDIDEHHRLVIRTLRLFDDKNDMIARIEDDEFSLAPSARHVKPDPSTFVVYDQHDAEVLRISYLNIQAVSIRGQFRSESLPPLSITDDKIQSGSHTIEYSCLGTVGSGDIFQVQ